MNQDLVMKNSFKTPNKDLVKSFIPALGLLLVILFFQISSGGRLLSPLNLKTLLNELFFIIIGATGYSFLISQGNLDFSIGSNIAVSCATGALMAQHSPLLALPAGIAMGALIGCLNGFVYAKLKVGSFIATLAMQFILSGVVVLLLNGSMLAAPLEMISWNKVSLKLSVMVLIVISGFILFSYTSFGKIGRAVGSCEEAARLSGVNITMIKFMPFVISGGLAGLLGFFSLIRTGTASSNTGSEMLMNVLNAVLLGGMPISGGAGTKFRAVLIGSLTMTILANGMAMLGVDTYNRQLIKGLVFITAIALSVDRQNINVIK